MASGFLQVDYQNKRDKRDHTFVVLQTSFHGREHPYDSNSSLKCFKTKSINQVETRFVLLTGTKYIF